jgi:predicted transcriptional regulator
MLTRLVATNLDEKTFSELGRYCKRNDTTVSKLLRNLIQAEVER